MKIMPNLAKTAMAAVVLVGLAGCDPATMRRDQGYAENPPPTLPFSINELMVGMVDDASDYIFALSNGDMPRNDADWARVRTSGYETVIGAKAMQLVGTGPEDPAWVADPEWRRLADELSAIGMDAVNMAEAKNPEGWDALGDRLVQNCLACHEAFKPEIPTQGIMHRSTKRESEGGSIFQ